MVMVAQYYKGNWQQDYRYCDITNSAWLSCEAPLDISRISLGFLCIWNLCNFSQVLPKIALKIPQNFHQNVF